MGVWNLFCALLLLGLLGFGNSQRKQGRTIAVVSDGKSPANFDCPEEFGYYPHPTDCTQYYVCVFGGALLESCTGGLMYSHELQTCDWPRNVGCDGLDTVSVSSPGGDVRVSVQPASRTPVREREERVRYTVVPTAQPQPVISSRGQSRQLHATVHERVHSPQDILAKQQQQQQLYADADDVLPPAEEIENDRQQRVYRGQPSTVGQVQRDRDGIRHTNAIPSSNRAEKIGVISFGTQQQQQQPVQQYRNDTFYIDNSLTDDLTAKRRRKRQTRRRLAPLDLIATADSSISWTRHVPVPHVLYQQQQVQQPKQTYQNHRLNAMELQPPPHLRFKPQQEYSAILSGDQTEFQPFSPNPVAYKTPTQPVATIQTLKPNSYIVPKVVKQAGLYQYFKTDPRSQFPHDQNDNYSYFNLGGVVTTAPNVVYAPSNQAKITQTYYQPNPQPPTVQYQNQLNQFRPITNPPSHIEYVNNHKPVPQNQEPQQNEDNDEEQEKQSVPANHKAEESKDEEEEEEEEEEEQANEKNQEQSPEIKPEFPSPPPFFFKSTNKYENIENPFADPNFDFDKFISKIKGHHESHANHKQTSTEAKYQMVAAQNDSKQKVVHSKIAPTVELRTPVAFSSYQNKKKVTTKPPSDDDYYYDDEEEEIYEKPKKPYVKHDHETPVKTTTTKTYSPINKSHPSSYPVNLQSNKKTSNSHLSSVTVRTEDKKPKPSKDKEHDDIAHQNVKPEDDEYEYYDDYDYDSEEEKDQKYEQPQIKKPLSNITTPKPVNNKYSLPKITNPSITTYKARPANYETIIYQNKSQIHAPKGAKYVEKLKENKPASSQTVQHKHITSSSPRTTQTTHKITTIKFPNRQITRLLTSTVRPRDKDATTRKINTKNSSRLEESNVNTQSHSIGASQSTPSGRLYNGSQHYDPTQYDPYYTLYEDDVELYRDVDYSQQQQYTSNRAQPQQVYRGTPAPVSVPVQSTIQEETVPQRNTAYYSTQAQDVYSQNYHDDNYDTQVDDQSNYRQSSRQPSRGDRNELSYFVESTPKSTTTIRTTTTTTTTTPRPIPVQKQSVVPSRSPIIAANQTRPQSIIITLSASPGQKSPTTQSSNTTTETKNETDSSIPKSSSRLISLSTGFNLRQTDNAEPTPVTYKPHFTQTSSTTDSSASVAIRPLPFSLTKLPDNETKSIVFRLSSRLSASSQNVSDAESQPSIVHLRSTESPIKREVVDDNVKLPVAHAKSTASTLVIPTTYSPSKAILASILPKYSDNESIKATENKDSSEERLVSILPKKIIIVNTGTKSTTESSTASHKESVIIENPVNSRTRIENNDKPVKTIIRKLPVKVESTTPTSFTERTKGERKIISKIHFGIPQTYTSPEKINNLATTPSSFSSTVDFEDNSSSEESSNEKSNSYRYFPESRRPVSAHYITTDLTTSQRPQVRFSTPVTSTESSNSFRYTPSTTEESSSFENINSEENINNQRPRSRFSFHSKQTTERGNSVKYTPNVFESEYIDSIEQSSSPRSKSKFSFNYNLNPTTERGNYAKYIQSTTEKPSSSENTNNKEIYTNNERLHSRFNSNINSQGTNYFASSTTERSNTEEEVSSNDRLQSKFPFNSNLKPTEEQNNYVKYTTTSTETPSSTEDEVSSNEKPHFKFASNSNFNFNTERKNYFKYTPSSTTDKPSNIDYADIVEDVSSSRKPHSKFSFNLKSTTERENYYSSSTTELPTNTKNEYATSSSKPYNRFSFNSNPVSTSEHGNVRYTSTSTTEKSSGADTNFVTRKPIFRFVYNPAPTTSTERTSFINYSTTEKNIGNESVEKFKPSITTVRNVPSTTTETSTSRPLYQYSSTSTTERPSTVKYVPSTTTSSTTTFRYSTTTTSTTSTTTSTTEHSAEKNKNSFISDRATEKYRFIESSSEVSDTDDKVRSQLFVNRNAKPFRATAELPTVSEILATEDEPRKKEVDSPPTYKPKPFSLTDANKNRTSADASRNVTLPVRLSRVNTAIKSLTAFGGTRRNSQTPKCNENQTAPDTKCNEIQKQRTSTRGRGSAHYTSSSAGENLQSVSVNRGTPATPRSRPTLKPSTSIVSKAQEYVDIYRYPPQRPESIYPQPQVDKTAAKCRKDVCLLPDCSCGGKEIPGDIPVEEVPQIVLLTFDDAVNDLNKDIYSELFEQGRTNPNGCPISATFYVSHEWTDYSQVQNLYADGHELASHTVSHSFGEQFSQKKWNREVSGQREILAAYGGVHLEDVRGMRAPFLSVGGNKMFKMLYDSNFTYDSSLPVYENRPPSWPYTLDYKLFHDCMIPPCPTRSYPGVWEVPMVMWQDLNGGRCSMGDACSNPGDAEGVTKMLMKNFERHYTTNRAPFGLFYHAAWFTQPHHKEGFIKFLDFLVSKDDVYLVTNWQALEWVREPTPLSRVKSFHGFQCNYADRPKRCNNPKVCNLWHKSGVRYMKTCQPCPDIYPWTGKTGIRSSRIDNDIED